MSNGALGYQADARYPSPGVYFEEPAPRGVDRIRTGVPAFLGRGQSAARVSWLTDWKQFAETIGPVEGSVLAHAVRGFFENEGERCAVVPLALEEPAGRGGPDQWQAAVRRGLEQLERLDDVDLVCAPDLPPLAPARADLQRMILEHCRIMGNRFAILDPAQDATAQQAMAQWHELLATDGALYFPWIVPPGSRLGSSSLPPCGHVAGVYARTDRRVGVHKAPANELVHGAVDVSRLVTDREQGLLNDVGVNCIRVIPGRGIRVWGARTLSGRAEWRYVNVRRLFLTLKRWIGQTCHDLPFEGNDPSLWNRIRDRLSNYCYGLFQAGALKGLTPEEAFYVKCDAETNPPARRDQGEVIAEIGLAPVKPAEFVVVRITQSVSGTSIASESTTSEGR